MSPTSSSAGKKPRRTDNVIVKHVTYEDNYFFTQRNEEERLHCLQVMPERYAHVWLGEPDDAGDEFRLLPYATLAAIANTDSWALRPQDGGRAQAGYDVAAQGDDSSALVLRTGPAIQFFAEQPQGKTVDGGGVGGSGLSRARGRAALL